MDRGIARFGGKDITPDLSALHHMLSLSNELKLSFPPPGPSSPHWSQTEHLFCFYIPISPSNNEEAVPYLQVSSADQIPMVKSLETTVYWEKMKEHWNLMLMSISCKESGLGKMKDFLLHLSSFTPLSETASSVKAFTALSYGGFSFFGPHYFFFLP